MCSEPKRKTSAVDLVMEGESQKQKESLNRNFSVLLELSASDDLIGFRRAIEEEGFDIDEASSWYGRGIGSKKMGFVERTPLLVASMFGSKEVVAYILSTGKVDVNRACGSDGATALHCAAVGGSSASLDIAKLLLDASADIDSLDANGNRPVDLIPPALKWCNSRKKTLEKVLKGGSFTGEGWNSDLTEEQPDQLLTPRASKDLCEKKEYPVDLSLPDIKNGIYGTDEFRMYTFKVKPCSRAYSHDWTECPFVHPGENARRRDPRKYHYSCVPCPEFRKGNCRQGDSCEYAHGVFECWLHPAQYRTRLCKDETGCTRRVCFFAHKPEELRPLYASTGSAVPSPRSSSLSVSSLDVAPLSPMALGSPSVLMLPTSTPPMSPSVSSSSPMGAAMWQNQSSLAPPTLQLPGSRLKAALSARDMDLDMELLALDRHNQRQQLIDEMSSLSTQSGWSLATAAALAASSGGRAGEYSRLGGVKPTNLDDVFGSLDTSVLSQLQGLSLNAAASQLQSPKGIHTRQTMNQQQLRSSYPTGLPSSPARSSASFALDPSGAAAAAVMNARSAACAKRSQSFIDRSPVNRQTGFTCTAAAATATAMSSTLCDWGSPDGKLDWGIQGEELNKLRKSASFGFRNSNRNLAAASVTPTVDEPDVSWVQSLVKDVPTMGNGQLGQEPQPQQYQLSSGGSEMLSPWVELVYMEQEQMVA
ncbi:PREDICTED: zinc finger CCCH domain-containing protein 66-like [Nelumbo nucifera]|uniref:Zinc finger CCCH domain-containing protein 66-like n=1 Tax=Nelumbo nucifera TaxID=4432 RepID=A0A1U7ZIN1_NELNU|nr:PREDICTED: zinc finger CCCH domain-containing protein 66-like [Nelumbo nucifera]